MLTTRIFSFVLAVLFVAGCGVRTGLDLYDDGGIPGRTDVGRIDAGRPDAGRDAGMVPCRGPADCDDGLFCNGLETCVSGRCDFGPPPFCDDGIDCTIDTCDETVGCAGIPDASRCAMGERCDTVVGGCVATGCTTDRECNDGDVCNGVERCGPAGFCVAGSPMPCPVDPFECTVESCDAELGCTSTPDHSLCPPRNLCTIDGGCVPLGCMVDGDCDDRNPCNGTERCAPGNVCAGGVALDCDDGDPCTLDRCQNGVGCVATVGRELCTDGMDNDCNGLSDCADPVCAMSPGCGCMPVTPQEVFCADGRDDDCNGLVDCDDMRCIGTDECGGCTPIGPIEVDCFNGRDDDCDELVDCEDMECIGTGACDCTPIAMTEVRCTGGVDEDCNGLTDCADPRCAMRPVCMSSCTPTAELELGIAACTNGIDDDCDRRPDCADPDCRPLGADGECCNGIDDTGEGNVDELTCYCEESDDCFGVGSFEQVCWVSTYSICAPDCRRYGGSTWCRMFFPELGMCNRSTGECEVP